MNNVKLFFIVLEAGMFEIKGLAGLVSGESPFPGLAVSSHSRGGKRALWNLFYKDTNPNHESSALMT